MSSVNSESNNPVLPVVSDKREMNWLSRTFILFGIIGFLASVALLVERVKVLQNPTTKPSCDINPFISCGGVAGFVVPIVIGVGILAGARFSAWFWRIATLGLFVAWIFVSWLFFQSVFSIGVLCPYCLVVWSAAIPMWWTVLVATISLGFWGAKIRNLVAGWGIAYLPALIILNFGVIIISIFQQFGERILDSF
jgi:uncharacterized membrane protein